MVISADYVITPVTISSLISTLISFYILSPVLSKKFFQQYNSFTKDKKIYWNGRPCSTIHAVVVCTVIVITFLDGSILNDDILHSKCKLGFLAIQVSAGYFIGDFIIIMLHNSLHSDKLMILHHISSFISVFLGLLFEGRWMMLILLHLFSELSTPFVNLHWLLIETKTPKKSWIFIFDAFGLTITFFISRIFALPLLVNTLSLCVIKQLDPSVDYHPPIFLIALVVVFATIQHCLNIFWSYKVARGFLNFLKILQQEDYIHKSIN